MRAIWLSPGLGLLACAAQEPAPVRTPVSIALPAAPAAAPAASGDEGDREPLAEDKARVLAMRAPRYAGTRAGAGDKDEALRFINVDLKAWLLERKKATDPLVARYEAAAASEQDPPLRATPLRNVAELQLDFARELIAAGTTAMPESFAEDPEVRRVYVGALVDAVGSRLQSARVAADRCVAAGAQQRVRAHCEELRREAAQLESAGTERR